MWLRSLKHIFYPPWRVKTHFPPALLTQIKDAIAASESRHDAEICFVIEASLPWSYLRRALPARARALTVFGKQRVWDTERNTGILLYVLLAERRLEIVVDRTCAGKVRHAEWQAVCDEVTRAYHDSQFAQGSLRGIERLTELLATRLPVQSNADGRGDHRADNPNELSNRPLVL